MFINNENPSLDFLTASNAFEWTSEYWEIETSEISKLCFIAADIEQYLDSCSSELFKWKFWY